MKEILVWGLNIVVKNCKARKGDFGGTVLCDFVPGGMFSRDFKIKDSIADNI